MARAATTFREKIIRVTASAAVCGLSMSFLAGEIVAAGGGPVVRWAPLSSIIPAEFPALNPAREFVAALEREDFLRPADALAEAAPHTVMIEEIRLAEAKLPPPVADVEPAAEVRKELERVHAAAAKVVVSDAIVQKAAAPAPAEDELRGRILISGSGEEPGHFEVGLFEQIDSRGAPIGFPLVQQILKRGKTEFALKIPPASARALYLFVQFFPDDPKEKEEFFGYSGNPVEKITAGRSYDVVVARKSTDETKAAMISIRGRVSALFAKGAEAPMPGALVRLRGTNHSATTNHLGEFDLNIPPFRGTALVEVIKSGFYPSIVELSGDVRELAEPLEIVSREAVDQLATGLGIRQQRANGVLLLRGPAAAAYRISLKAQGPYYFTQEGHLTSALKQSSSDGRAMYLNVEPGSGHLEASLKGESLAPVSVSVVEGGGLMAKRVTPVEGRIRGRVFNPVSGAAEMKPMAGVRVRIDGAADWSVTDSTGAFELPQNRFLRGETVQLEVSSEKIYHHRYSVRAALSPEKPVQELTLFVFPQDYLGRLATSVGVSLDPYSGMIVGGVGKGAELRLDGLADHSEVNNSRDFYFDEKAMLRGGAAARTHPGFGTFVIFNVPRGRVLLHGVDRGGAVRYARPVVTGASVVTVVLE